MVSTYSVMSFYDILKERRERFTGKPLDEEIAADLARGDPIL
jgi:hypothetical protein